MSRTGNGAFVRATATLAGLAATLCARADMDEAWLGRAELPTDLQPLLAIVLDHSEATAASIAAFEAYDPMRDYGAVLPSAARCDPAKVYWRRAPGPAPDCASQAGLDILPRDVATGLHCEAARASLGTPGFYVASRAAQWRAGNDGGDWQALHPASAEAVECRADRGRHGASTGAWYAGDGTATPWTGTAAREVAWNRPPLADAYTFYSGNFLNYLHGPRLRVDRPIAELIAGPLAEALTATDELAVALVRIDDDGPDGGFIARAPVASHVAAADVQAMASLPPAGSAPLAETLVEAASWLQGGMRRFGTDARADTAASDPLAATRYRSPFEHACRPVSLAILTAGRPSGDDQAATTADALSNFSAETGGCTGNCLATLSAWLAATDLRGDLAGTQSAPLVWITPSSAATDAAAALTDPLSFPNLIAGAFQRDAAVAAGPQLSAAALTPLEAGTGRPDVILGLNAPRPRMRWPGNLLRYGLRAPSGPLVPPLVVDREGAPAIDPGSGLPLPGTRSFWSDVPDANLLAGGANGRLPPADARRIFTDVASARLLDPANRLEPGNARIDRAALGLAPGDSATVDDALGGLLSSRSLGDPGLHAPLVIDDPASDRVVAFVATQDGLLHAIDAMSGAELWAWMPKELLPRVPELLRDTETTARSHGIDGPLVLHRHDADGDGRITPAAGEHLWLLFGLGRGGGRYYALDVAAPMDPRLLWSVALPDSDVEARAEPVVSRLAIAGSGQAAGNWVVLVAGGYDTRFDSPMATGAGSGNALLVLDAASGRSLWSAGGPGSELDLSGIASLASAPRVLDLDGDRELDRAYLLDVTGSLWRIDFASGRAAGELATARLLARLGTGGHRFHATPDAFVARAGAEDRIAIAAGSGNLSRPRDTSAVDRLYVIFDRLAGAALTELAEEDLYDATEATDAMPAEVRGWFVRLDAHGEGEKVIGPAVTFDHALRFVTYQPLPPDLSAPCGPPRSVSRRYALDIRTALPRAWAVESEKDENDEFAASGLPVGTRFGFPARWDDACEGCRLRPFGITGGETFDPGYAGDPVRTSWRKLAPPPASP